MILLSCIFDVTAIKSFSCFDYPNAGIIILLDESDDSVTYNKYIQDSDLLKGWTIHDQDSIDNELMYQSVADKWYLSKYLVTVYQRESFRGAYGQTIDTADEEEVDVIVEYFDSGDTVEKIYKAYLEGYM